MKDIQKTLNELKIEDFIWIVSLFVAGFAILSNKLERDAILYHNQKAKKEYKTINITLLIIGFFIYLYFLLLAYSRIKEITPETTMKNVILSNAKFLAASLLIIGAVIAILVEIASDDDTGIDLFA